VQGVLRRGLQRIVVGRIASGSLAVGQHVVISPSRRSARIASLEAWPPNGRVTAQAGESVGFTLDAPLFIDRGDVVSDALHCPPLVKAFKARLLWLGERPLSLGDTFRLRVGTRTAQVAVSAFERVIETESLDRAGAPCARTHDVAEVVLTSPDVLALDAVTRHRNLARFVLLDGPSIVAGGTVLEPIESGAPEDGRNLVAVGHLVERAARTRRNLHRGAVLWLTGLPAAGKSTIAMHLERRLFDYGAHAYVLDGDNVRSGLCSDLGFSPRDRRENIRRVGEVAALFADAGTIAIAAFISPYRADRALARRAAGEAFHEIYIKADAAACERRDPKGHYRKARSGELPDFTGITGDYEEPLAPELVVDTTALSLDESVETLLQYVEERLLA
jgi:bifunctional enzyme CysN/CysC